MENTGTIVSVCLAGMLVGFLAWRVGQERARLREVVGVLNDPHDPLVAALEDVLRSGSLAPAAS